jgi:hypothetical protein
VIAHCLCTAAELALARNDPLRAAQLVGASDEEFAALGVTRASEELETQQRILAALVDALGAEQLEASRRQGAALPHEELVEPVLGAAATKGLTPNQVRT